MGTASVRVTVVRAEGLRNADIRGMSDAYVVVKAAAMGGDGGRKKGKQVGKTRVVDDSLSPEWRETFLAAVKMEKGPAAGLCFRFEVLDKDRFKSSKLGSAEVVLDSAMLEKMEGSDAEEHVLAIRDGQGVLVVQIAVISSGLDAKKSKKSKKEKKKSGKAMKAGKIGGGAALVARMNSSSSSDGVGGEKDDGELGGDGAADGGGSSSSSSNAAGTSSSSSSASLSLPSSSSSSSSPNSSAGGFGSDGSW